VRITESGSSLTGSLDLGAPDRGPGALTGSLFGSSVSGRTVHLQAHLTPRGGGAVVTLNFDGVLNRGGDAVSGSWQDSLGGSGTVTLSRGQASSQQFDLASALATLPQDLLSLFAR